MPRGMHTLIALAIVLGIAVGASASRAQDGAEPSTAAPDSVTLTPLGEEDPGLLAAEPAPAPSAAEPLPRSAVMRAWQAPAGSS